MGYCSLFVPSTEIDEAEPMLLLHSFSWRRAPCPKGGWPEIFFWAVGPRNPLISPDPRKNMEANGSRWKGVLGLFCRPVAGR
jgi:hypothetical protein